MNSKAAFAPQSGRFVSRGLFELGNDLKTWAKDYFGISTRRTGLGRFGDGWSWSRVVGGGRLWKGLGVVESGR